MAFGRYFETNDLLEICCTYNWPPCFLVRRLLEVEPWNFGRQVRLLKKRLKVQPSICFTTPQHASILCSLTQCLKLVQSQKITKILRSPQLVLEAEKPASFEYAAWQERKLQVLADIQIALLCDPTNSPEADITRRDTGTTLFLAFAPACPLSQHHQNCSKSFHA